MVVTWSWVTQVDLCLTVVTCETGWAAAPQPIDWVDGSKQHGVGGDEWRRAVKFQYWYTLHVVLTGFTQADVIIEGKHALAGDVAQQCTVQVDLLLELLWGKVAARGATRKQGWEGYIENAATDIAVILHVEDKDTITAGRQNSSHALGEQTQQWWQEAFLGHVLQAHGDAVSQHVVCDDGHTEGAECCYSVESICKTGYLVIQMFDEYRHSNTGEQHGSNSKCVDRLENSLRSVLDRIVDQDDPKSGKD